MAIWKRLFGGGGQASHQASNPVTQTIDGPGKFKLAVVSESNYQRALWRAVENAPVGERGYSVEVLAALVPEPTNKYDENAIQISLDGNLVGYLSRDDAVDYADLVRTTSDEKGLAICRGLIRGGFVVDTRERASLGIWLDLPSADGAAIDTEQVARVTGTRSFSGNREASEGGLVRGKHYTDYVEDVKALKRHAALDEALLLLHELIDAVEKEAAVEDWGVAPWYYEQVAIICRKKRDLDGEITVLERFAAQKHAPGEAPQALLIRLEKARQRETPGR